MCLSGLLQCHFLALLMVNCLLQMSLRVLSTRSKPSTLAHTKASHAIVFSKLTNSKAALSVHRGHGGMSEIKLIYALVPMISGNVSLPFWLQGC